MHDRKSLLNDTQMPDFSISRLHHTAASIFLLEIQVFPQLYAPEWFAAIYEPYMYFLCLNKFIIIITITVSVCRSISHLRRLMVFLPKMRNECTVQYIPWWNKVVLIYIFCYKNAKTYWYVALTTTLLNGNDYFICCLICVIIK